MTGHQERALLAVDVGTSAVKAVVFTPVGQVIATARGEYILEHPQPDHAVQAPGDLQEVIEETLRAAIAQAQHAGHAVTQVILSGTMHGLLALDDTGTPLTPVITWADGRAAQQAAQLRAALGTSLYAATGVPIHAMTPFAKLLWLREHEPEIWARAKRFVSVKEWLIWQWTGQWLVDEATAAATGLYSMDTRDWQDEWLCYAHVDRAALSVCVPAITQVQVTDGASARRAGMVEGTVLMVGSTDGVLANLGTVGLDPRLLAVTAGTSAAVRRTVIGSWIDANERTFCYPLFENYWVAGGASNAGAMVLSQVARWLAVDDVQALFLLAQEAPPGSAGALFVPWLAGERAPMYDAMARGGFVGLSMAHDRRHLARAAIEGVALTLRSIAQALSLETVTQIVTSGGLAQSSLWRQLLADVMGLPVQRAAQEEATCLGAFLLASRVPGATALTASMTANLVGQTTHAPVIPSHERAQVYAARYETFRTLYRRLHDPV